jgi:hypothetical protein
MVTKDKVANEPTIMARLKTGELIPLVKGQAIAPGNVVILGEQPMQVTTTTTLGGFIRGPLEEGEELSQLLVTDLIISYGEEAQDCIKYRTFKPVGRLSGGVLVLLVQDVQYLKGMTKRPLEWELVTAPIATSTALIVG